VASEIVCKTLFFLYVIFLLWAKRPELNVILEKQSVNNTWSGSYALPIFFSREIRQIQTKLNKKRALRHVFVHV